MLWSVLVVGESTRSVSTNWSGHFRVDRPLAIQANIKSRWLMAPPRYIFHIAPILQWRREGEKPFEVARLDLVALLDSLLAEFDKSSAVFTCGLGGQTILLDDYFEVRPSSRGPVDELLSEGRFEIGPWFIIPYDLLVSGESLVRNLEFGKLAGDGRGIHCQAALLASTAGHIDQLPQILRSFDISGAIVPAFPDTIASHAVWSSDDGSQVLWIEARRVSDIIQNEGFAHILDITQFETHSELNQVLGLIFVHASAQVHNLTQLLSSGPNIKEFDLRFGTLSEYLEKLNPVNQLRMVARSFPTKLDAAEYPIDTASTRGWIKQRNQSAEQILLRWAEPFSAWSNLLATKTADIFNDQMELHSPAQILEHAWRILLQNQSPEILSGVHVDDVDSEVDLRFTQVHQIGREISIRSLQQLVHNINTMDRSGEALGSIVVFNPAPIEQTGIVAAKVAAQAEIIDKLILTDPDGNPVPSVQDPDGSDELTTTVRFLAKNVPAIGYRTYTLGGTGRSNQAGGDDSGTKIENEFLNIDLDSDDGTFDLFDKRTGRSFSGLNRYVDGGDAGDLRLYAPPNRDTLIQVATNSPLHVDRIISPVEQCLRTFQIYRIPETLNEESDARMPLAAQFVPISVWTTLRLGRSIPRVDIEVTVSNTARNHRLRAHFPTGIHPDSVFFDSQYGVTERKLYDLDGSRVIHQGFVTVPGSNTGITLAARGLPEVELEQTDEGMELALTMLRCTEGFSLTSNLRWKSSSKAIITSQAQCLGDYSFSYCLIPHSDDFQSAWREAWAFQNPLDAISEPNHDGKLPSQNSLISSTNPSYILTAVRETSTTDELLVRGYNLSDQSQAVNLQVGLPFRRAQKVQLDNTPVGQTFRVHKTKGIDFVARPKEIVTLLLSR